MSTSLVGQSIRLELLGGFRLLRNSTEVALTSRMARAVLVFLVLRTGDVSSRSQIATQIWPDEPESVARRRLSQALWRIHQALPELSAVLRTEGEAVWLEGTGLVLDVAQFGAGIQATQAELTDGQLEAHRAALDLYIDDLLPDWGEEWLLEARLRWQEARLAALGRVTVALEIREDLAGALGAARAWVAADGFDEAAHRAVMRLHARLGRADRALEQFALLRERLSRELGAAPDAQTQDLQRRIFAGAFEPDAESQVRLLETGLIGREDEFLKLTNALSLQPRVVLLEAEAGLGKTRLLRAATEDATWQGTQIIWVQGKEFAGSEAYAALRDALQPLLTPPRVARLTGRLERVWLTAATAVMPALQAFDAASFALKPQEEVVRLRESLYRLISALCEGEERYWLVLDDAQWADEGTLSLLEDLARRLPDHLSLLVAYRSDEARERPAVWDSLSALGRRAERITLRPLTAAAALQLAMASLGTATLSAVIKELLVGVTAQTRGQPLYLLETLRALAERGTIWIDRGVLRVRADTLEQSYPLNATLHQTMVGRLSRLNHQSRRLLGIAALMSEAVSFDTLLSSAGRDDVDEIGRCVDALERQGWLERHGTSYQVAHDLLRTAIVTELEPQERKSLHISIAEALGDLERPRHTSLVTHYEGAERWAAAAQSRILAAAEAVSRHDHRSALQHLQRTLESPLRETLSENAFVETLEALWKSANVLSEVSVRAHALDLLESTQTDPARVLSARLRRAELLSSAGQFEAAVELATRCKVSAESAKLPDVIAQAASSLRLIYSNSGQLEQAVIHGAEAVRLFAELGELKTEGIALMNLGGDEMRLARVDEAYPKFIAAQERFLAVGHLQGLGGVLDSLAVIATARNQHAQAQAMRLEGLRIAREIGWLQGEGTSLHNLGWAANEEWLLADGLRWYEAALEVWLRIGNVNREMVTRQALMGVYLHQFGDWERAETQRSAVTAHPSSHSNPRTVWFALDAQQLTAEQQGQYAAGLEFALRKQRVAAEHNDTVFELLSRWGQARLRCKLGQPNALEDFLGLESEIADFGMTGLEAEFDGQLGEMLVKAGRPEAGLTRLDICLEKLGIGHAEGATRAQPYPAVHHLRALALQQLERPTEAAAARQRAYQELIAAFAGVSAEVRAQAFQRVPDWREIISDWEDHHVKRVTTQLPLIAPSEQSSMTVHLTLGTPEDARIHAKTERRQAQLRRVLREIADQGATAKVTDLAALFGCGTATIKRDLAALRRT